MTWDFKRGLLCDHEEARAADDGDSRWLMKKTTHEFFSDKDVLFYIKIADIGQFHFLKSWLMISCFSQQGVCLFLNRINFLIPGDLVFFFQVSEANPSL